MENYSDRVKSIGKFKLAFIHSIDLYALLDNNSKNLFSNWRAYGVMHDHFTKLLDAPGFSMGTFYLAKQGQDGVKSRMKHSIENFEKSILAPIFFEKAIPLLFEEHEGQKFSNSIHSVRLGKEFNISDILSSKSVGDIRYTDCELKIFHDGVLSVRFEFCGEDCLIETFISLVTQLRQLTQTAMLEKISSVIKDLNGHSLTSNILGLKFLDSHEIINNETFFRRVSSGHAVIILESMKDKENHPLPVFKLEEESGLLGVLRQTQRAVGYKKQLLDSLKDYNLGYKSDEIYITFRGTTLIVLPKHWDPNSFLAIYIYDLMLLIEYYVSKITLLDVLVLAIQDIYLNEPLEDINLIRNTIKRIILLRRTLMLTEESIDVDLVVNHYFTRGVLLQLIEQRGISNKLEALKRRISNLSNMLDLVVQSSYSNIGLGANFRQISIAIWALLATLVFSLISLLISIVQLIK